MSDNFIPAEAIRDAMCDYITYKTTNMKRKLLGRFVSSINLEPYLEVVNECGVEFMHCLTDELEAHSNIDVELDDNLDLLISHKIKIAKDGTVRYAHSKLDFNLVTPDILDRVKAKLYGEKKP